ncbi:MAG: hypothetical protein R2708_10695 [Vicinamibacterales bacterium]
MSTRYSAAAAVIVVAFAGAADAQVIGTFSWQTQPYCNVITVQVIQQGPLYQLTGSDNLCGTGTAPVTGTAVPAGGAVVFGLTAALPSGRAAQISASISLATVSGTWADADGHTGAFAFAASTGGSLRPAPAPATAITAAQFSPTIYEGTGVATTLARSDHDHDTRYYTRPEADAQRPEVVFSTPPPSPTIDLQSITRTVTTTRAGRLYVKMSTSFSNVTCTAGTPMLYVLLDGVPVPSSALLAGTFSGYLIGTTASAIPAGAHTVGVGADCPTGPATGGVIITFGAFQATAIVLP